MLKKKVASTIIALYRKCSKCGANVEINPTEKITRCHKCGEIVYEDKKLSPNGSTRESKNSD